MDEQNLNVSITGGWAAMLEHYFLSAWVPANTEMFNYYSHVTDGDMYTLGMLSAPLTLQPGATTIVGAKLYTGPEIMDRLKAVAPNLDLTIDYGFLWFISIAIFWLMKQIYQIVGNWGWSIVLVTVIIKLAFYHLSAKSYRSMAAMRKLQPRLQMLKERYGDDKQKLTQTTMELYKAEKINPLGGCLPVLVQIPVFIALYWVLIESVELRQAPFILWIHDLSAKDPYFILPIIMGITMFIQQHLNPPPADPVQAKMMKFLPIFFTFLFINFPAGLVLYWIVNNSISILQQWYITKKVNS
jgi:YidC/Oxa1 family membrane protein insertase